MPGKRSNGGRRIYVPRFGVEPTRHARVALVPVGPAKVEQSFAEKDGADPIPLAGPPEKAQPPWVNTPRGGPTQHAEVTIIRAAISEYQKRLLCAR